MSTIMDELTPTIVAQVQASKEAIIASAGSFAQRSELRLAWPVAMNVLPTVLAQAYAAMLKQFGSENIATLAGRLASDMQVVKTRELFAASQSDTDQSTYTDQSEV